MKNWLFLLPFLLFACTKDSVQLDCPSGIGVGNFLVLPDDGQLELVKVNDNLCPCDAVCIWAGYLEAELSDGKDVYRVANTNFGDSSAVVSQLEYRGFVITLDDYVRTTECGSAPSQEDYCITFGID